MRTDTPTELVSPDWTRLWTAAQMGWDAQSIPAAGSRTGSWVTIAGVRRLGIFIQCDRPFIVSVLCGAGGLRGNHVTRNQTTVLQNTYTVAGVAHIVIEACAEEVAVHITNSDGSNAANVSAMMTGMW